MLLGDIGRPQGLKGEVRIRSFTAEPAAIADYGALEDETGARAIEIESLRTDAKGVVARIKGVTTREGAEALTGTKLYVPRSRLPEQARRRVVPFRSDRACRASTRQGGPIGTVVAIHNFGAGDLLEIRPAAGGPDVLVPFTRRDRA